MLLILAAISIATLTGENGILTKADTATRETEIEDAKEQAKIDIMSWTADKVQNGNNADLNDEIVKGIVTGKEYVKEAKDTSFTTKKNGYDIPYSELYKKIEITAEDIVKSPSMFYGAKVSNYSVASTASDDVKNAVQTWRIFYAGKEPNGTEENIYLIADDYISYTAAPNGQGGSTIEKNTDYELAFDNVYSDYAGSEWILGTTEGKAKYAIGGSPLEMYCTSYKETHPKSTISCVVTGIGEGVGYECSHDDLLSSDCNEIYIKPEMTKVPDMWLASPAYRYQHRKYLTCVTYTGYLDASLYYTGCGALRPVDSLKSGITLEEVSEGEYRIK